jgi:hypothetical protein
MDKKKIIIAVLILVIVSFVILENLENNQFKEKDVKTDSVSASGVVTEFFDTAYICDYRNAERIISPLLSDRANSNSFVYFELVKELTVDRSVDEVKILDEKVEGEKAEVTFRLIFELAEYEHKWNLVKENGSWKIDMDTKRDSTSQLFMEVMNAKKEYKDIDISDGDIWIDDGNTKWMYSVEKDNDDYMIKRMYTCRYYIDGDTEKMDIYFDGFTYEKMAGKKGSIEGTWGHNKNNKVSDFRIYKENGKYFFVYEGRRKDLGKMDVIELGKVDKYLFFGKVNLSEKSVWEKDTGYVKGDFQTYSFYPSDSMFVTETKKIEKERLFRYVKNQTGPYVKFSKEDTAKLLYEDMK